MKRELRGAGQGSGPSGRQVLMNETGRWGAVPREGAVLRLRCVGGLV